MGGLVGAGDDGIVSNSYSTATVTAGPHGTGVGGLIGSITYDRMTLLGLEPDENVNLQNLFATGAVSGSTQVGGLIGSISVLNVDVSTPIHVTVDNAYATGNVSIAGTVSLTAAGSGGLIGSAQGPTSPAAWRTLSIENVFATGNVSDTRATGNDTGGLIGTIGSLTLDNASATGNVSGSAGGQSIGGLVGASSGSAISNAQASGTVSGDMNVGGLVGQQGGFTVGPNAFGATISNSSATGNVTATGGPAGGLLGANNALGVVDNSFATGNVTGPAAQLNSLVPNGFGGLVGDNFGTIKRFLFRRRGGRAAGVHRRPRRARQSRRRYEQLLFRSGQSRSTRATMKSRSPHRDPIPPWVPV